MPSTAAEWIAWGGLAIPLLGFTGTALAYVVRLYQEAGVKQRERFFELMKYIDSKDLPLATKMAAVYQLREFSEHKEFIIRFCDSARANVSGNAAETIKEEFKRTADYFRGTQ